MITEVGGVDIRAPATVNITAVITHTLRGPAFDEGEIEERILVRIIEAALGFQTHLVVSDLNADIGSGGVGGADSPFSQCVLDADFTSVFRLIGIEADVELLAPGHVVFQVKGQHLGLVVGGTAEIEAGPAEGGGLEVGVALPAGDPPGDERNGGEVVEIGVGVLPAVEAGEAVGPGPGVEGEDDRLIIDEDTDVVLDRGHLYVVPAIFFKKLFPVGPVSPGGTIPVESSEVIKD